MAHRVCPWWVGYLLANPLRRLIHNPEKILAPFVAKGMTVLDVGPGMGFFALPMARMAGPKGRVVCVDVQERMLRTLLKRAAAAGLADRIVARVSRPKKSLCIDDFDGKIDFALLFAVVHEVPDPLAFLAGVSRALKPGALCLVAEPKGHVSFREFEETLAAAGRNGLVVAGLPAIFRSLTAVLRKGPKP
jgi:ubiquinone/menaquinone biosynthesis C-methylase UbiE